MEPKAQKQPKAQVRIRVEVGGKGTYTPPPAAVREVTEQQQSEEEEKPDGT